MAYLSLRGVGKIYVSGANVAVGIRGATLDFELGEFVAVTGKSGSGKSTLLNVISGMDTYEEGELLIEGQATSHYVQKDWEAFRERYISFIFQDYNIIESFTVLENVELALMHIEDRKERRRRALELLERVGLSSHLKHKGSRLSGGQKQRVVIARALAKDSPILLADEPTGNLDSNSAKEIVALLYEISKEKLVIVVTHNFEQLEGYATRHVRVFDGAIERDLTLAPRRSQAASYPAHEKVETGKKRDIRNGAILGKSIFFSRPRLSFFLCLLMILGTFALFAVTGFCGDAFSIFEPHYMFTPIDGRVIMTAADGRVISASELSALAAKYGAKDTLHYDWLLDTERELFLPDGEWGEYITVQMTFGEEMKGDIVGRYPEQDDEILVSLPIGYQPLIGKDEIVASYVEIDNVIYRVVGAHYEVDNNLVSRCVLTEAGYRNALAAAYLNSYAGNRSSALHILDEYSNSIAVYGGVFGISYAVETNKIYAKSYDSAMQDNKELAVSAKYLISGSSYFDNTQFYAEYDGTYLTEEAPNLDYGDVFPYLEIYYADTVISPYLIADMVEKTLETSYSQASLFFESEGRAEEVVSVLLAEGYRAVSSYTTYSPDAMTVVLELLSDIMTLILWVGFVIFLGFFISLCTGRALAAFKGDMAIMRSMGISVRVIRIAMYFRMLIAVIPGYFVTAAVAVLLYTSPVINSLFTYLYAWQYALIFVGMLILVAAVTKRQIAKLFSESVKKALKGGDAV